MGLRIVFFSTMGLLAVLLFFPPSGAAEDAAVSLRGWSMTAAEIASECDRVRGAGAFDSLDVAARVAFARTLADREILFRLAKSEQVAIAGRAQRGYRAEHEKLLIRELLRDLRDRFHPDSLQEAREFPRLLRAARTEQFLVIDNGRAVQAENALREGRDFAEAAKEFCDVHSPGGAPAAPVQSKVVRIDDRQAPVPLLKECLLRDLQPGSVGEPVRMPEGTVFVRVLGYEPLSEASDSSWLSQARRAFTNLLWIDRSREWSDSLKQAAGLATHPETYALIVERFAAMWDSLQAARAEGFPFDILSVRPPAWRFSRDELALPVYELRGRAFDVADYLAGLEEIDVEYWPGMVSGTKALEHFEARVERILLAEEANRRGIPSSLPFREALQMLVDKWLLEAYFGYVTASIPDPSPDSLAAAYQRYRSLLAFPEAVSFSLLSYPPSEEARAREILQRLRAASPDSLAAIGPREAQQRGAWFVARTQLRNVALGPFRPELADYWPVALELEEKQYSDVFRTSAGGWAFVRVEERRPARDRTMAEARPYLLVKTKGVEQNRAIERILERERLNMELLIRQEPLRDWRRN